MLRRLVATIESRGGVVTLRELSRALQVDQSTVRGMLDILTSQGRLCRQDSPMGKQTPLCAACGLAQSCGRAHLSGYTLRPRQRIA